MADKCVESLQPEIGRELCLVEGESCGYRGYKRDILTENLSEREITVFVCSRCQGVMREVCLSSDRGEQFCSSCIKEGEQANFNLQMDKMILSFKCSCPLIVRGCKWLGALGGCEEHLDMCDYVLETCKLRCGVVLQRDELKVHEKEKCPQRIVECKHCRKELKSCELATHVEMCPKMEVSCELKCGKRLCRENMAQHLKQECGLVVETCRLGCGVEMTRDELKIHVTETCVQRFIPCEHCKKDFKFCDMIHHLDKCPKMKVSCELKCGVVMCREDVTQHVEHDCVEKEIECPFVKYKCVVLIKRKNLVNHLDDKRMEHLELKMDTMQECMFEESETTAKLKQQISKQNEKVSELNENISKLNTTNETMSHEINSLKNEVEILTYLLKAIKLVWRITEVPECGYDGSIRKQFQVAGYNFDFWFLNCSDNLQIRVYPLRGLNYDKLKWPFKAEFVTHLSSQSKPGNIKKFKSEVFVWKRERIHMSPFTMGEYFMSYSKKIFNDLYSFYIATFPKDEFLKHFINGEAEFEIFVIIL